MVRREYGKFIVKWDLENWQAMKEKTNRVILKLIRELRDEGKL